MVKLLLEVSEIKNIRKYPLQTSKKVGRSLSLQVLFDIKFIRMASNTSGLRRCLIS